MPRGTILIRTKKTNNLLHNGMKTAGGISRRLFIYLVFVHTPEPFT